MKESKENKKPTLFDYLNAIFYKKPVKYDKKVATAYILSLWLSHEKDLINSVNRMNELLFFLSDDKIFNFYWHYLPRGKRFIKYTKKEKQKANKSRDKKIEELMNVYGMSKREAELTLPKE